jgi:hypothetical protein
MLRLAVQPLAPWWESLEPDIPTVARFWRMALAASLPLALSGTESRERRSSEATFL